MAIDIPLVYHTIAIPAIMCLTIFVAFIWAGTTGNQEWWFPFISETGSKRPESSFFSFGLYCAALVFHSLNFALNTYFDQIIHYEAHLVDTHQTNATNPRAIKRMKRLNLAAVILLGIATIGLIGVASVQESLNAPAHTVFAYLFFVPSYVGVAMLTAVMNEFKHSQPWSSAPLNRYRVALTVCAGVFVLMTAALYLVDTDWSALFEWLYALAIVMYIFSLRRVVRGQTLYYGVFGSTAQQAPAIPGPPAQAPATTSPLASPARSVHDSTHESVTRRATPSLLRAVNADSAVS